jgi:hypothetical protein
MLLFYVLKKNNNEIFFLFKKKMRTPLLLDREKHIENLCSKLRIPFYTSFILTFLCFILSGIFYLLFVSDEHWYINASQTNCIINKHLIIDSYCNDGENTYLCYDGFVKYNYTVSKKRYKKMEKIVTLDVSKSDVKDELKQYPIGSVQTCWYENSDPNDVTLVEKDNNVDLILTIVFFSISIIGILVTIVFFIYYESDI